MFYLQQPLIEVALQTGVTQKMRIEASETIKSNREAEEHFRTVESQFLRFLSLVGHGHRQYCHAKAKVDAVEYIVNPQLVREYNTMKEKFSTAKKKLTERYGFHGTRPENISSIFQGGFKVGDRDLPAAHGTVYGRGVYLSTTPSIADKYSPGRGKAVCLCNS